MNEKKVTATIAFCQCGSSDLAHQSWVGGEHEMLVCKKCGRTVRISRGLTAAHLLPEIDLQVLEKSALRPPPKTSKEQRDAAAANRPTKDKGWVKIHYRITVGQREVVKQAEELYRTISGAVGKTWHGTALERICAYFISGNAQGSTGLALHDPKIFSDKGIDDMKGAKLEMAAVFVFGRGLWQIYKDEDDLRKWIKANLPPELVQATQKAGTIVKKGKKDDIGTQRNNNGDQ